MTGATSTTLDTETWSGIPCAWPAQLATISFNAFSLRRLETWDAQKATIGGGDDAAGVEATARPTSGVVAGGMRWCSLSRFFMDDHAPLHPAVLVETECQP